MSGSRIDVLLEMRERNPQDTRILFALATELEKVERWSEMADMLTVYLERADDQGNAWGRLGSALRQLGRDDDAKDAYARGIEAARRHGHPGMAAEFEDILADW